MANGYLANLWDLWMKQIMNKVDIQNAISIYGYDLVELTETNILVKKENETFEFQYGVKYN
jgi:hypothetical protein